MTEPNLPDDELDPTLQERFAVLGSVAPPDTWPGAGRRSVAPGRRWIAAAAAMVVIAGSLGWALTRNNDADVAAGDAADSPVGSEPSTFVCPVTVPPEPGFTPPEPWAPNPSTPDAVWYGTDELWTVLELDGHTPRKSVWWSAEFPGGAEEERPPIAVVYERLDATADIVDLGPDGTNANTAQDGWFMIAGGQPDTPGCWQATATYKGATLSYVYEVSGPDSTPAGVECPSPEVAAGAMTETIGVAYDYDPSASPADAGGVADHVVVGWVTGVGFDDDGRVWLEMSDLEPTDALGSGPLRLQYEEIGTGEVDGSLVVGVLALAMLHDNEAAIGGLSVALEGLWFSCDDDATAYPAKLAPVTAGWPAEPTIARLLELMAAADGGVDGPLMFSAPWDREGSEEAGIGGTVVLDGDCLFVQEEMSGLRVPVLWPYGTAWQADPAGVVVPSGEFVPVGGAVSGGGGYYSPEDLDWVVQDPAALAMADRCAGGDFREIVVVQGGSIEPG